MKLCIIGTTSTRWSLNPFEFRAGLKQEIVGLSGNHCLNPFEFRAGLKLKGLAWINLILCLNPFEFRAGLKQKNSKKVLNTLSLNPFEFRAGLKLLITTICAK